MNNLLQPYILSAQEATVLQTSFSGYLMTPTHEWITSFVMQVERGVRDERGVGVSFNQFGLYNAKYGLYSAIKDGTTKPTLDDVDIAQIYMTYDKTIYGAVNYDRKESQVSPLYTAELAGMFLAKKIRKNGEYTIVHEFVGDCAGAGNVFYNGQTADLGTRGSATPQPDSTITDVTARANKFMDDVRNAADKVMRNSRVVTADATVRREYLTNALKFQVVVDDVYIRRAALGLATLYGTAGWKMDIAKGSSPDGSVIAYTTSGTPIKSVRNMSLEITNALTNISKANSSRPTLTTIDANFKPVMIICPTGQIAFDLFFQDPPSVQKKTVYLNERMFIATYRFLAKALDAEYVQTATGTDNQTYTSTKLANSNQIFIFSDSTKPTLNMNLYSNYKILMDNGSVIAKQTNLILHSIPDKDSPFYNDFINRLRQKENKAEREKLTALDIALNGDKKKINSEYVVLKSNRKEAMIKSAPTVNEVIKAAK